MSYRNKTYVVFDGDEDMWAYAYMKGWIKNDKIDFNFHDAHDISRVTSLARDENYIKKKLKERFNTAKQLILLIGEKTKNKYKYVRWELEVAKSLGLPIIGVNLNNLRGQDSLRVPPIIKNDYVVYVSFKMKIIKYALDNFPSEFKATTENGPRYYNDDVYKSLGL